MVVKEGRGPFDWPLTVIALLWLAGVGFGMRTLWGYSYTPGPAAAAVAEWPANSALVPDRILPTLVVFAHPQCPCTRVTLEELARLLTHTRNRAAVHVVFYRPASADPDWARNDIWDAAAAIPGVDVRADEDGRESERFGAFVSGQTFLYDAHRRLLFSGGITLGRGHAGDNPGRDAIESWLSGAVGAARAPVFGCLIRPDTSSPNTWQ